MEIIENRPVVLAPMAGVTDAAFRRVCRSFGADRCVGEMVSARALTLGSKKTEQLLRPYEGEDPVIVQIFGHEPAVMAEAAKIALHVSGGKIVDINMGCPVGKVVKSGDGSALMRTPELASDIVKAVCDAVDAPVTVKFRKGWDGGNVNAVEFAGILEEAGAAAIAVHGRTRVQMYSGLSDREIIRKVKEAVHIPVTANGDVFTAQDAVKLLSYTNADAVMAGRGAFGNPWLFRDIKALMRGEELPAPPTLSEKVDVAVMQAEAAAAVKGERIACLEARRHFAWYLKGTARMSRFKEKIVSVSTLDDIRRVADEIKRYVKYSRDKEEPFEDF